MAVSALRCAVNPLISPADVRPSRPDLQVIGVFNAAVALHKEGVFALLRVAEAPTLTSPEYPAVVSAGRQGLEVERLDRAALSAAGWDFTDPRTVQGPGTRGGLTVRHLTSISHLRAAWSDDGERFQIAPTPTVAPTDPHESWGVEDPRLTPLEGGYQLTYSAVSPHGIATMRATSSDLRTFARAGLMFPPENRNVALYPERIGGFYYALHRPVPQMFGDPAIWLARSPDLVHWGEHKLLTATSDDGWQAGRIGAAAPPIRTDAGWLVTYHAADRANRYCLGAMLFALDDPSHCTHRLPEPLLEPTAPYEADGFFSAVVFSCGAVIRGEQLWIYYGAADRSMAAARFDLPDLLAELTAHPATTDQV
ncbi:MAG: glycoside hydrolase family 130 protein [Candidatus Nanopelagicales bacterium]